MVGFVLVVALLPRHLTIVVVLHHEHLSESDARHKSAYAHERLHTEEPKENIPGNNNLKTLIPDSEKREALIKKLGVDPRVRPENLTIEQFIEIARNIPAK